MFAFAKKLVSTIEQQATENFLFGNPNDQYFLNCPESGLRVLSVLPNSLSSRFGFESWFDYIIKVNNYEIPIFLNPEGALDHTRFLQFLNDLIQNKQNLSFQVWSAKGGVQRIIQIPFIDIEKNEEVLQEINLSSSQELASNVIVNSNTPFANIGISLQLTPLITSTYTWHILQTHPNSPAYKAGLLPQSDYIIGAQDGLLAFGGEQLLSRVVASRYERNPLDSSMVFYVYNHDFDIVRPVTIQPAMDWGGQGLLGCDVGYGLLHRIPEVVGKFTGLYKDEELLDDEDFYLDDFDLAPGKELFNSNSENVFIPSSGNTFNQQQQQTMTANFDMPPPIRKKKTSHNAKKADFLSYYDEETKKSQEVDKDLSGAKKDSSMVPPPPPPPSS